MSDMEVEDRGSSPNVSRETMARLGVYEGLIRKWTQKINLVSKNSLDELRQRHINDCLAVLREDDRPGSWVDLGSGAGLPGLVVAIKRPDVAVTLIESDQRKCAFMREVARQLDLHVTIVAQRIEETPPQGADYVSARALAPLDQLLAYVHKHLAISGKARLMKGMGWKSEVEAAKREWNFDYSVLPGSSDGRVVLELKDISRA